MKLQDYLRKSASNISMKDYISVDVKVELDRIKEIENTMKRADCVNCAKMRYQNELNKIKRDLSEYEKDKAIISEHIKTMDLQSQSVEQLKIISTFMDVKVAKTKSAMVKNIEAKTK